MWTGVLVSLKVGTSNREFLTYVRGLNMPFKVEATGHRYMYVLKTDDPRIIEGYLASLRVGSIPIGPITLARPFNIRYSLGESKAGDRIVYNLDEAIRLGIQEVLRPRPLSVRLRTRGHGLGVGDSIREEAMEVLRELGVRVSRKSELMLNIEALRTSAGGLRVYVGFFHRYLYVRYASVHRLAQTEDNIIPKAGPFTQYY